MVDLAQQIEGLGVSRRTFAVRVGCSASFLSEIINGRKTPGLALAVAIQRETNGKVPVESWVRDVA